MNRQIKFRAWDKENKEMIPADAWFFSDEFEPFIFSVEKAQESFEIMQFTGLHDKNGKEIYQGDIVRADWHWKDPHVIEWPDDYYDFVEFGLLNEGDTMTEILGNRFEHHYLLKEPS